MSTAAEQFLTREEETAIVAAIRDAEKNTSGEIRVHIEGELKKDVLERAKEVFHYLKMDNTKAENGVLFYIAVNSRTFAVYGDRGINKKVPENFWEGVKNNLELHFKKGEFSEGLVTSIGMAGIQLEKYFPWHESDINELDDTITKS